MSRSGPTNFDSDDAFDYFLLEIAGRLTREIEYWLAAEQIYLEGSWLARVLNVIEIMLLFDQHDICFSGYIKSSGVQRWRSTFMPVWDGEWKSETNYPSQLDDYQYRQQHRLAIEAMFNRLEGIGHYWESDLIGQPSLPPLLSEYPLPHFSIRNQKDNTDAEFVVFERFIPDLIRFLRMEIIYWLSPEMRNEAMVDSVAGEEVPAAAELLAFICENYRQRVGITGETVRNWCEIALQRIREFAEDKTITWETGDERLKVIKATFDKLEAMALKYPPDPLYDLDIPTL